LLILTAVRTFLLAWSLVTRNSVDPDEGWFISVPLSLLAGDGLSTVIWGGWAGTASHTFWYPPLMFLSIAAWFVVAPDTVQSARVLSLAAGTLAPFVAYAAASRAFTSPVAGLAAAALLLLDPGFTFSSSYVRPEVAGALLVLFTFLLLGTGGSHSRVLLSAGAIGGIAILLHPNGAFLTVGMIIYALTSRVPVHRWLLIVMGAFLVVSPYVVYITLSLSDFWTQATWNYLGEGGGSLVRNITAEGGRYSSYLGFSSLSPAVALVAGCAAIWGLLRMKHDGARLAMSLLVVHLAGFALLRNKWHVYFSLALPVVAIVAGGAAAEAAVALRSHWNNWRLIIGVTLASTLLVAIVLAAFLIKTAKKPGFDYVNTATALQTAVPAGSVVVANPAFVAEFEYGHFYDCHIIPSRLAEASGQTPTQVLENLRVGVVIVDRLCSNVLDLPREEIGPPFPMLLGNPYDTFVLEEIIADEHYGTDGEIAVYKRRGD
jgi:4-amino-4-deoxy-L-arabinose transferase-like glycosyltransferase